ncbi:hypothetical protein QBC44DRAFT_306590 [Cladorrhinum sp. PSN332]|nr:hypothetical protein QBC44DRAFT_306590 [Cladorrhinum sp. PSN332]
MPATLFSLRAEPLPDANKDAVTYHRPITPYPSIETDIVHEDDDAPIRKSRLISRPFTCTEILPETNHVCDKQYTRRHNLKRHKLKRHVVTTEAPKPAVHLLPAPTGMLPLPPQLEHPFFEAQYMYQDYNHDPHSQTDQHPPPHLQIHHHHDYPQDDQVFHCGTLNQQRFRQQATTICPQDLLYHSHSYQSNSKNEVDGVSVLLNEVSTRLTAVGSSPAQSQIQSQDTKESRGMNEGTRPLLGIGYDAALDFNFGTNGHAEHHGKNLWVSDYWERFMGEARVVDATVGTELDSEWPVETDHVGLEW